MPWGDNPTLAPHYLRLTWQVEPDDVEEALAVAYRLPVNGVEYDDGTPHSAPFADIPLGSRSPYVRVYLPVEDSQSWVHWLRTICEDHGWAFHSQVVLSEDWAHSWKSYYHPQILPEGYAVVPAWWEGSPVDAAHTLWLDPGMAFGTGLHATTRLCLEDMARRALEGRRVLDIGAGSGILGLFSLLRGAKTAVLVEPDPVAVNAIWHNARLNGLTDRITVIEGTLQAVNPASYHLVCMNLIWDIIQEEWPRVTRYLAPNAYVLLSGLLCEREDDTRALVTRTGDVVERIEERDGWLLVVVRHGAGSR